MENEPKIEFVGSIYGQHSRWGVFKSSGISPTLPAAMGMGGGYIPMVIIRKAPKVTLVGNLSSGVWSRRFKASRRVYDPNGISPTIIAGRGGVLK